jgi:pimeloyl-ACP methyl ester carboxylesterase
LTPVKYSTFLQQNLCAPSLVVIPEAGHMVMAEKPGVLNVALERFLNQPSI